MTKRRPTDEEFAELKRKRDGTIEAVAQEFAQKWGIERKDVRFHCSGAGDCYCACPEGPCQHEWGGWREFEDGCGGEQICKRCGMGAMTHSMRTGP